MNIVALPHIPQLSESSCSCRQRWFQHPTASLLRHLHPRLLCPRAFSCSLPTLQTIVDCQGAHFPGAAPTNGGWELMDNAQSLCPQVGDSTWFLGGSPGPSGTHSSNLLINVQIISFLHPTSHPTNSVLLPEITGQIKYLYSSLCLRMSLGEESKLRHWFRRTYLDPIQPLNVLFKGVAYKNSS